MQDHHHRPIPAHIGIVGCSSEGAALCYRTICQQGAKRLGVHAHRQISMHTHSLADYVRCLEGSDLDGIADLMLSSAQQWRTARLSFGWAKTAKIPQ